MKVAFVGSSSLPLGDYAHSILKELARLPEGTHVLVRKGVKTEPGQFEILVAQLADRLGMIVDWQIPEENGGRAAVYERDIAMAQKSDEVVAFFDSDQIMAGGTGHVVEKAIDADRLTNCYALIDGEMKWVGGHQPTVQTVSVTE